MPTRRSETRPDIRAFLLEDARSAGLHVANRVAHLDGGQGRAFVAARIDALEAGYPIALPAWRLEDALYALGVTDLDLRDHITYTVDPDGGYRVG